MHNHACARLEIGGGAKNLRARKARVLVILLSCTSLKIKRLPLRKNPQKFGLLSIKLEFQAVLLILYNGPILHVPGQ